MQNPLLCFYFNSLFPLWSVSVYVSSFYWFVFSPFHFVNKKPKIDDFVFFFWVFMDFAFPPRPANCFSPLFFWVDKAKVFPQCLFKFFVDIFFLYIHGGKICLIYKINPLVR